jgi:guanine nucleotide-binding protein subunit alpha
MGANIYIDLRMRFAEAAWEKERNGWRGVVQLNVVRSITTILDSMESEMNIDPAQELDGEATPLVESMDDEEFKFDETHSSLLTRLAPLRAVETLLKRRLGPGSESEQLQLPMSATPFDQPTGRNVGRLRSQEFAVRSWKEVLDPESRTDDAGEESVTSVLARYKDDMKALWNDKNVRLALKRWCPNLSDSAEL